MKPITLEETKETIHRWIGSCQTHTQLDLLIEVVATFVVKRFEKTEAVVDELTTAIASKKADLILSP